MSAFVVSCERNKRQMAAITAVKILFNKPNTPVLTTARLILRPRRVSDAPEMLAYLRDPKVRAYLGGYPPDSIGSVRAYLRAMRSSPSSWTLMLGGSVIGECDLFHYVDKKMAYLGYILASPYWGKGLMREACAAALDYGFQHAGLIRIRADVDARNEHSSALLLRLGFSYEATLPDADFGGRLADVRYYSLTRAQWSRMSASVPGGMTEDKI